MFHDSTGSSPRSRDRVPVEAGLWECPPGRDDWQVPATEVDAAVRELFAGTAVWRLYADPPVLAIVDCGLAGIRSSGRSASSSGGRIVGGR